MLDSHLGFYRVGDETILVRGVMHFIELIRAGRFVAGPFQFRMELHFGDCHPAFGVFFHVTDCFINVFVEDELLLRCNREKREHVASGERRDECFLRIDILWIAEIDRRGSGRHFVAAIKFPGVIARIFLVLERHVAAGPGKSHFMFGHVFRISAGRKFSTADYADEGRAR